MGEICQLQHFPLNDCPKYTALSYTWQSPLLTDESIAGYNDVKSSFFFKVGRVTKRLAISKNLDEALFTIIGSRFCNILKIPDY